MISSNPSISKSHFFTNVFHTKYPHPSLMKFFTDLNKKKKCINFLVDLGKVIVPFLVVQFCEISGTWKKYSYSKQFHNSIYSVVEENPIDIDLTSPVTVASNDRSPVTAIAIICGIAEDAIPSTIILIFLFLCSLGRASVPGSLVGNLLFPSLDHFLIRIAPKHKNYNQCTL